MTAPSGNYSENKAIQGIGVVPSEDRAFSFLRANNHALGLVRHVQDGIDGGFIADAIPVPFRLRKVRERYGSNADVLEMCRPE
jgi:hypothetical protein